MAEKQIIQEDKKKLSNLENYQCHDKKARDIEIAIEKQRIRLKFPFALIRTCQSAFPISLMTTTECQKLTNFNQFGREK